MKANRSAAAIALLSLLIGLPRVMAQEPSNANGSSTGNPAANASAQTGQSAGAEPVSVRLPGSAERQSRQAAIDALEPAVDVSRPVAPRPAASAGTEGPVAVRRSGVIDTLDLGTTSITGNQELPKVLYIVPWKQSDLTDLIGRPVNTLLDEVMAPIDPEVFERHLDYYDTLYGKSEEE